LQTVSSPNLASIQQHFYTLKLVTIHLEVAEQYNKLVFQSQYMTQGQVTYADDPSGKLKKLQ
jgi:hypothetical protein